MHKNDNDDFNCSDNEFMDELEEEEEEEENMEELKEEKKEIDKENEFIYQNSKKNVDQKRFLLVENSRVYEIYKRPRNFYGKINEGVIEYEEFTEYIKIYDRDAGNEEALMRRALKNPKYGIFHILILVIVLIFGFLLGKVMGGSNNTPVLSNTPPVQTHTQTQTQTQTGQVCDDNSYKAILSENEKITKSYDELKATIQAKDMELYKCQIQASITANTPAPVCPVVETKENELLECKKELERYKTPEMDFMYFLGKKIKLNCAEEETQMCKDLYFLYKK